MNQRLGPFEVAPEQRHHHCHQPHDDPERPLNGLVGHRRRSSTNGRRSSHRTTWAFQQISRHGGHIWPINGRVMGTSCLAYLSVSWARSIAILGPCVLALLADRPAHPHRRSRLRLVSLTVHDAALVRRHWCRHWPTRPHGVAGAVLWFWNPMGLVAGTIPPPMRTISLVAIGTLPLRIASASRILLCASASCHAGVDRTR